MEPRICAECGRIDLLDYGIKDPCWEEVVPKELQPEIVCLTCFDWFAFQAGVTEWHKHLVYVKFLGKAGSFRWSSVTS